MADLLVVEDDMDAAEALGQALEYEGHQVRIASNGERGLSLLERRLPDLVLLDVDMPVLDGPGMSYRMMVHNAGLEHIPILLVSGVPDLRRVAARLGTPYFLSKPYRLEQLHKVLARALLERREPSVDTSS